MGHPRKIIVKTMNKNTNTILCKALKNYPRINFFSRKINGEYCIIIKCANFYKDLPFIDYSLPDTDFKNIYGSYIYLYTTLSLILSDLIIDLFERNIINRLFYLYYFYFTDSEKNKIRNISSSILDPNFPSDNSRKLYLYKKELILNRLILNFRNKNYISVEAFANFGLDNYYSFLDDVIEKSAHIYFSNTNQIDLINFILNNLIK